MSNSSKPQNSTEVGPTAAQLKARFFEGLPPEQKELFTWVENRSALKGSSSVASELGYSASTLSRFFAGVYNGSIESVFAAVSVMKVRESQAIRVAEMPFIQTSASKKIFTACDYAFNNRTMVEIIGSAGVGKTRGVREWAAQGQKEKNLIFLRAPNCMGPRALWEMLASKVDISSRQYTTRELIDLVPGKLESKIVVIDHAHRMIPRDRDATPHGLETIIDILEATGGIPIVLLATERWSAELDKEQGRYIYDQYNRRVDIRFKLPEKYKEEEVGALLNRMVSGITSTLLADALALANSAGRLGTLEKVLNVAERIRVGRSLPSITPHIYGLAVSSLKQLKDPEQ